MWSVRLYCYIERPACFSRTPFFSLMCSTSLSLSLSLLSGMTLPPMAVQRDGIITSSAAPLLPTCLPTYKHHLAQELYTYLDDDELVVMVMMIEPAAVPLFFPSRARISG